jgi:DNA-directed RNA polymerase II subunit RPB2
MKVVSGLPTMNEKITWKIIDSYFQENPQWLVSHHVESFNDFYKHGIYQLFKEQGPIELNSKYDDTIKDFRHQCKLYIGGKSGNRIYFGKPVIFDKENTHYMFPNEARLRNMSYSMTIHYDVEVEFTDILEEGEDPYPIFPEMLGLNETETTGNIEDEYDYTKEANEEKYMKAGNFKEKKMEGGDAAIKQFKQELKIKAQQIENNIEGGAKKPKGEKKKEAFTRQDITVGIMAKLRNELQTSVNKKNIQIRKLTLEKILLGKFPIMVQSDFCILNGLPREMRFNMGECRNDFGGYFIIDGKEKTVIPQEKFGDNMLYIHKATDDKHLYVAEIKSVSENVSKPIRTLSLKIVSPSPKYSNQNIVVNIPNVKHPVPLFIVFRALGILSDKKIIQMCLLDMDKYEYLLDDFIPSIHDASPIFSQLNALQFIAKLTKYGTVTYTHQILSDYFLPHIGETNYIEKAYYLGYMVFRLLCSYRGLEQPVDRDNFKYKRIELIGDLMGGLFREYYTLQQKNIHLWFEKKIYYNKSMYESNLPRLIMENYKTAFGELIVDTGFRKAFKGNWGSQAHTKRIGIIQDLNRLSNNSVLSHLRKTNLPLDATAKVVGPRVLHCSQWGFIDPIDTPDGGNIGLHKTLSIFTQVSRGYSREVMIDWLREKIAMKKIEDCGPELLSSMTKIMVNGYWAGSIEIDPFNTVEKIKLFRRNGLIPIHTSITFEPRHNTIYIYTDAGRVCRPIYYVDKETNKASFESEDIIDKLKEGKFSWNELVYGFNSKKIKNMKKLLPKIYELYDLYDGITTEKMPSKMERFIREKAIIDYIDPSESENALIAINPTIFIKENTTKYTHIEIDESLIFGILCNQIVFPENNPPARNSFSCVQSKQAISIYHTNFHVRMDKAAVVLNYPQKPIVKTRYLKYLNNEENPYGENAIVAIMCYTGYNVEDAVLINEAALQRGLFNTTYYTCYETHEETSKHSHVMVDKKLTNIETTQNVIGTIPGYDYSKLDKHGIIKEGETVNDKTVLIGLTCNMNDRPGFRMDESKMPKKGQLGVVDKTFVTEGEEGERIAKVRIREIRIPNLGDKMASRVGQKGTVGLIIPETDMPFTKDGIRPDIIINPHAIPTRMTIGQLVESIMGKVSVNYGGFSDCTAFVNEGTKIEVIGKHLVNCGFHSSGNEFLYNGMTGQQIETEIFIGPTYYMRLKQMVKDKINYRSQGPRTALTRQPVSGRANDGGLRIGEMERDVLISHGISDFLRESMMERGDKYYMAICNNTGMMAIYNPDKNLFLSPMADGPIRFTGSIDKSNMRIENVTKFGRSFSVVCVPYSFKLLMQELQTINLQMRIITEDNIEQLENLSFSNNIENLLNLPGSGPKEVIEKTEEELKKNVYDKYIHDIHVPSDIYANEYRTETPIQYPEFMPQSPEGPPPGFMPQSPEGPPPGFMPQSPEGPPPGFMPQSPEGPPPGFVPRSPEGPPPGFVPRSPEGPPPGFQYRLPDPKIPDGIPPDNCMEQIENKIMEGGSVYYRGDNKPNRIWNVKDIGNGYYTIETDDLEGINDLEDTVKVVSPIDIFDVNSVMHYTHNTQPQMISYPIAQQEGTILSDMGRMPDIKVNPIINVVTGNNNKIEDNETPSKNSLFKEDKVINVKTNNEDKPNIQNNVDEDKRIDFTKLVIKKV